METSLADIDTLINRDASYVWHPFTQAKIDGQAIPIVSAKGSYLFDYEGRHYIDAISSWWVTLHGHGHPYIIKKIYEQMVRLEHVIFANFTHSGAAELAQRLVDLLNMGPGRVFFADNGSTAVETALKIALQFWYNQTAPKSPKQSKIVSFENGYHGDTFGAMSAGGKTPFNPPFWPYLFSIETIDPPYPGKEEASINQLKALISKGDIACFIFEPLIQGVGGMTKHSPEGLDTLIQLCHQHQVITIADEVMTGFGRTGPIFACDSLSSRPDMTCLSKGLTGGFMPFGAVVCREWIYDGFFSDLRERAFLHCHTFCGNPMACAAALASLDLLLTEECADQRNRIEKLHQTFCDHYGNHPHLKRCEVTGTILALEYNDEVNEKHSYFSSFRNRLLQYFLKNDIFVRPFGNVLHLIPPYCISHDDLHKIYACILETLENKL